MSMLPFLFLITIYSFINSRKLFSLSLNVCLPSSPCSILTFSSCLNLFMLSDLSHCQFLLTNIELSKWLNEVRTYSISTIFHMRDYKNSFCYFSLGLYSSSVSTNFIFRINRYLLSRNIHAITFLYNSISFCT